MKLLILSIEFPPGPGGLGTLAYQIAWYLARVGWQVVVSTPQDYAVLKDINSFNANQPFDIIKLRHLEPSTLEGVYRLAKALKIISRGRPDVVLAIGKQAVWLGAMLSFITGVSLVAVGGGSEFLTKKRMERAITRWAFERAQCVVAISKYTKSLIDAMGIDISSTVIIPPGADDNLYLPSLPTDHLRSRLELGSSKVILTVGRVSERKAQDVVIRALPIILQECSDAKYLIVGFPERIEEFKQVAQSLGVDNHVVFLGQVPQEELPYFYNLADVFVLVSRRTVEQVEGFGIVAVEAALCGTPAVVSRNCGLEEAVVENETAFVVPTDDPKATAKAIIQLLKDDDLRTRMGQAAFQYAFGNATWEKRMREYDAVLRSIVTGVA